MPTFGSLFAGIGGFDLGLERAGWTCRWQVELAPFCRRVLAKHWPTVARSGDIRSFPLADTERVDLICGGFPCQPVSVAGQRRRQADERWLWPEFGRVICALRPRLVLVENVPGLLHGGVGDVLGDLAASGYDAEWDCLPASALGAPHQRDRVWLVAYPRRWDARGLQSEPEPRRGDSADALHDGPEESVADTPSARRRPEAPWSRSEPSRRPETARRLQPGRLGGEMADAHRDGLQGAIFEISREGTTSGGRRPTDASWWAVEPEFRRVVDGLSQGLDGGLNASQRMGADRDTAQGTEEVLRTLWCDGAAIAASQGWREDEQLGRQLAHDLSALSYPPSLAVREETLAAAFAIVRGLRKACETLGALRNASQPLAQAWLALSEEDQAWCWLAARGGPWVSEWAGIPRVARSVPARVDRLRGLGNAVVPQVTEWIGRRLTAILSEEGA